MELQIQLELCIHGGFCVLSHTPIYNAAICGANSLHSPLLQSIPIVAKTSLTRMAMATRFGSQPTANSIKNQLAYHFITSILCQKKGKSYIIFLPHYLVCVSIYIIIGIIVSKLAWVRVRESKQNWQEICVCVVYMSIVLNTMLCHIVPFSCLQLIYQHIVT